MNENYIKFTTDDLNNHLTDLYEAMFEDNNDKEIFNISGRMIEILKDIREGLDKS